MKRFHSQGLPEISEVEVSQRETSRGRLYGLGVPLLIGLAVREVLAPVTGHPFDFEIWVRLGVYMQSGMNPYSLLPYVPGLSFAPQSVLTSISYPPLSPFIFGGTYLLYQVLGSPSAFVYYFLLKQPMVFSDLAVAVLLFKIGSLKGGYGVGRRLAVAWLYLPFAIIISSIWGTLDPLALATILGSVYFALTSRATMSGVLLGLSIYLKLMPVIFIPVFVITAAFGWREKARFAAVSSLIPVVGTLAPFYLLGWNFTGIYNAVSYQGSLPDFGGMGIFNALSLLGLHGGGWFQLVTYLWAPALAFAYYLSYRRRSGLVESLLTTVLMFSIFRPTMPEQWALYPLAFLLVSLDAEGRSHFTAIAVVATAFLATNNFLLVRFFSPLSQAALSWDSMLDSASSLTEVRYALMLVFSVFFSAEALSIVFRKRSILSLKLRRVRLVPPRAFAFPIGYLAMVAVTGGLLDFTATKMVTDWALAIESSVFLGLSWLSLYHVMLVVVFETMTMFIVLYSRRGLQGSARLFLLLTFLNVAASGLSLVLYRALEGVPLLESTTIYLLSSAYLTEEGFVVFTLTLAFLGIFFLDELVAGLRRLALGAAHIPELTSRSDIANSIPPSA